jgi:hypothetical protein
VSFSVCCSDFRARLADPFGSGTPILVFGQTALFFYILHIAFLEISARALDLYGKMGLGTAYMATIAVLILLYPCCLWYRRYKTSHAGGWIRYL